MNKEKNNWQAGFAGKAAKTMCGRLQLKCQTSCFQTPIQGHNISRHIVNVREQRSAYSILTT
jgi:hypothetical protein